MSLSLSESTYLSIKEDIAMLKYHAGEFLNEQNFASIYGVSKPIIRDAFHRLCHDGILTSYARKGYLIVTLTKSEFNQIQELRIFAESLVLEDLIKKPKKEIQLLKDEFLHTAKNSIPQRSLEFHMLLAKHTNNKYLEDMVNRLLDNIARTVTIYLSGAKNPQFLDYQNSVISALMEDDLVKAKSELIKGIRSFELV